MFMEERQKPIYGWAGMTNAKRELRKNMTRAEVSLWQFLRDKRFNGLRFRRQHGIGPYVVDFYHAPAMVVIELDGKIHNDDIVRSGDKIRQQYLEHLGYHVIRFGNEEVYANAKGVIHKIGEFISQCMAVKNL